MIEGYDLGICGVLDVEWVIMVEKILAPYGQFWNDATALISSLLCMKKMKLKRKVKRNGKEWA